MVLQGGWIDWRFHSGVASQVALVVKNLPASAGDIRDTGSIPASGRSPRRRKWQSTPVFLPGESHGQRSRLGTVHGVTKSQAQLKRLSMHQQYVRSPIVLYLHQWSYYQISKLLPIWWVWNGCLPKTSVWGNSLIPSQVEHFFTCLLFYSITAMLALHLHALENPKNFSFNLWKLE